MPFRPWEDLISKVILQTDIKQDQTVLFLPDTGVENEHDAHLGILWPCVQRLEICGRFI